MQRLRPALTMGLAALTMIVINQNCSKVGFDDQSSKSPQNTETVSSVAPGQTDLPDLNALAYGAEADDRVLLAKKIAGYQAPHIREIFGRWRRFSNNTIYESAAAIVPEVDFGFCFTKLDPTTGDWAKGTDPKGKSLDPGTSAQCIDSTSFASASWSYLADPNRLHIGTNAGQFNGFISSLPFERYVNQAVLTSPVVDDDEIGLVIATVVDKGIVHTLSAVRNQGGTPGTKLGFSIVYRQGTLVKKILADKSVGGQNKNRQQDGTGGSGDFKGWSGRMTMVKVVREGDSIKALASDWNTDQSKLALDPKSELSVDLSDASLGLEIFRGAHYYGYAIVSQQSSEFRDIKFTTTTDDQFVYDLKLDLVYEQQTDGTYALKKGSSAIDELGFPRKVINTEIQKQYHLNVDRTFTRLEN